MATNSLGNPAGFKNWGLYGIFVNVFPGSLALSIVFVFLPAEYIPRYSIAGILNTYGSLMVLFTGSAFMIAFGIVSYFITHVIELLYYNTPFSYFLKRVFRKLPLIPQPYHPDIVSENINRRFTKSCNQLFSEPDDDGLAESKYIPSPGTFDAYDLAGDYLLNKGIERIRGFEGMSSAFRKIWFISVCASISVFISAYSIFASDYQDSIAVYWSGGDVTSIILLIVYITFIYMKNKMDEMEEREIKLKSYEGRWRGWGVLSTNFRYASYLSLFSTVLSFLLSIESISFHYESILYPSIIGSPYHLIILFIFLSYISFYQEMDYRRLKRQSIMRNLYVVALSEGDIEYSDENQ